MTRLSHSQAAERAKHSQQSTAHILDDDQDWFARQMQATMGGKKRKFNAPAGPSKAPLTENQQNAYDALSKPMTSREVGDAIGVKATIAGGFLSTLSTKGLVMRRGQNASGLTIWSRT